MGVASRDVKKGSYVLLMELRRPQEMTIGKLGPIRFRKGFYYYVGSAMNGLDARVDRHRRNEKRMHWHIDYLLREAEIKDVLRIESRKRLECIIAGRLSEKLDSVRGFGCSDCGCRSHLFYSEKDISGQLSDMHDELLAL